MKVVDDQESAGDLVDPALLALMRTDPVAKLLGAWHDEVRPGYARVVLDLGPQHQNFNGTPHGGITFTLADLAFGAACNAGGTLAALVSASLNYTAAPPPNARLIAEATEEKTSARLTLYRLTVTTADGLLVASGQGTAYRWPGRKPGG